MAETAAVTRKAGHHLSRNLVGSSAPLEGIRQLISKVAPTDASVLILGESGTGKEVVARCIHDESQRAQGPFVPVNCGAIPAELLESELFGHEKGAFTGAVSSRKGRFEMASGGTLFLDEIGDMPLQMQVKLLRVLQERSFERVGSNTTQMCDLRVIAATHQNLQQRVDAGEFRMDLFYRLDVFPITIPPLRERVEDIPPLVKRFVALMEHEQRGSISICDDAMDCLMRYRWPGNVRELSNLVERLAILFPDSKVRTADLPPRFTGEGATIMGDQAVSLGTQAASAFAPVPLGDTHGAAVRTRDIDFSEINSDVPVATPDLLGASGIDLRAHLSSLEHSLMVQALERSDWVVARAATLLGLQRTTLVEKMRKYDISRPDDAPED